MSLTRREVREKALQTLFQFSNHEDWSLEEAMRQALLSEDEQAGDDEEVAIPEYLEQLVRGVLDNQSEIDEHIQNHLQNWSMSRLAKTDLIIMRVAIYEMLYVSEVPDRVALNEALEITKRYSDEKSRKFVNGILANVVNEKQ